MPESFDMLAMTKQYLPYLKRMGAIKAEDDAASELALSVLSEASADVPIVVELGETVLFGKLKTSAIASEDISTIEDLEGMDSILLCIVINYARGNEVTVYDPLKDFVKLNRAMRREMKRGEGLEPLVLPGPVLKVEVIAIYR